MRKIILILGLMLCSTASAEIALIVNKSNSTSVDKGLASKIFIGKSKSFSDGGSATPVTLSAKSEITKAFNKEVIGKSSSQIKAIWSKLVFTGKGSRPKSFSSDAELIKFVAENPSAIGFIDASNADDSIRIVEKF